MTVERVLEMKELVEEIAKLIVDSPEKVSVESGEHAGEVVLQLKVAPDEVGKVIGKQGRTVRSIRNILSAASRHSTRRYNLEITEPGEEKEAAG